MHEYAARRSEWLLRLLPAPAAETAAHTIEEVSLAIAARFYSFAQVLFAPNAGLCAQLEQATGRRCFLMPRGVDADLFHPRKRNRADNDRERVLGFVGRLSIEKNIALLATIQRELEAMGVADFHFRIVGHGAEQDWLRANLPRAELPGVLQGEALSAAYANMDLFVFPSHTDTFGNVVLEAMASGVPAVVTPDGGPKTIVRDGETGRIVPDEGFAARYRRTPGRPRATRSNAPRRARLRRNSKLGRRFRRRLRRLRYGAAHERLGVKWKLR